MDILLCFVYLFDVLRALLYAFSQPASKLRQPASGRKVEILTTRPWHTLDERESLRSKDIGGLNLFSGTGEEFHAVVLKFPSSRALHGHDARFYQCYALFAINVHA
ncbi:MAG: hypothetical protein D6820_12860 [Lentisphaerae bacterium]|nr:MAG: hypothetical protein D6820_12860 [Lentisphaerota bacterium]